MPLTEDSLIAFSDRLAFAERVVYWFGGWHVFNDYPFGVGLGNAGFYMVERMNGQGLESMEVRNLVYRAGYLPNTKNLWTRLLAETGILGLAVFLVWLVVLWRSAARSRKSENKLIQILGLAGQLFLMAYLVEGAEHGFLRHALPVADGRADFGGGGYWRGGMRRGRPKEA